MLDFLSTLFQSLSPLWEMSITAAYAAAVVIVLRLLLKKRAPKQVLCLLWLVVFARLLIPMSLESPLSIVPSALPGQEQQIQPVPNSPGAEGPTIPIQSQNSVQDNTQNQTSGGAITPAASNPAAPSLSAPVDAAPAVPHQPAKDGFPWLAVLAGVWLAGVTAMGGNALASYFRLRRRLFDAIRAKDGAWEHPDVDSPFILGMFRPRIYLPAGLVGQPRKFILCHERAHLRRLDHIVKPVCWAALALHWFNPLVWAAFILMSRDIEAACDEAVIRRLGPQVKADYSTTLLALATGRRAPSPCPLAFDEGDAKGRIQNVLRYRRPTLWVIVVSVVMAVMAAVCLLTDPVAAKEPDSDPDADPSPSTSASQAPDPGLNALLDPWMLEVLDGERSFTSVYISGNYTINDLRSFYYGDDQLLDAVVELGKLAIVDLDRDGVNEMVIYPVGDNEYLYSVVGYLILRRQGDEVYGYAPGYRSFEELKADGTFQVSSGAADWGICSMSFDGNELVHNNITWCSSMEGPDELYFVDGLKATESEFWDAVADQDAKPEPAWYVFEDGQLKALSTTAINVPIPLDEYAQTAPVPGFLDADQQLLYRQMNSIYRHLFGGSTSAVCLWGDASDTPPDWADTVEHNGNTYTRAWGRYAQWDDFEEAVLSVFSQDFWDARNSRDFSTPIFLNVDGQLYFIDADRGNYGYNDNFPETFRLVEQTDDTISFIMTGHYSETHLLDGETSEQRAARLAAGWEYSIDFPIRMVKTADGWRFDEFYCAWTDNFTSPFSSQQVPNPDAIGNDNPSAEVCVHGFDHVYVSTLDGTDNSRKIYTAQDTSMIFRCLEDGFTYVVPAPITGRDYWFGYDAADDFDGDGRTEEAILQEGGRLIMVCDAEDGLLRTCTADTGPMIDTFNQSRTYSWTDEDDTLTLSLSCGGQTVRAQFTGAERELILNYGEKNAPMAFGGNAWLEPYTGQDIILSLPIYLTGSVERDFASVVSIGTVQWTFHYGAGQLQYVPDSFRLISAPLR